MTSRSIQDYRRRNEDAPLDLVKGSDDWKPVVRLIDDWAKQPLDDESGYSSQDLDHWSETHRIHFPPTLREWWRLAGRHPFVDPGLLPANAKFLSPQDRYLLRNDLLTIAVDDVQTWSCNGIHADFLSEANPGIHGTNSTIKPQNDPSLTWYKGQFIATGLQVPALVFATLLYHLFKPSPLIRDDATHIEVEREGLRGGQPDERLISELGLTRFPNDTIVGDIYSDGKDIIYWWLLGCACRTAEAAERVRKTVPPRVRL
jgi:hypothetical protein